MNIGFVIGIVACLIAVVYLSYTIVRDVQAGDRQNDLVWSVVSLILLIIVALVTTLALIKATKTTRATKASHPQQTCLT